MRNLAPIAAAILAFTSTSALAAPTITFNPGSGDVLPGSKVFEDFEGYTTGEAIGTKAFALDHTSSIGARPAFGSTGNYGSVLGGGSFSINFGPTNLFSYVLGSLDTYNTLTLNFADSTSLTYKGSNIIGGMPPANGDRKLGLTNGIVSYSSNGGPKIVGATFVSNNNSFEFDNLATAVPEPATWAMMLLGFGAIGSAVRRRKQVRTNVAFA